MQMINNYLNGLESYLPDEMKQEVRDELEESLLCQVEDKQGVLGRELNVEEVEALLKQLGHPMRVASAYLPKQQLIGPELFPAYKKALEIALVAAFFFVVLFSLPGIFSGDSIVGSAIGIFAKMIDTGLYVFAIVSIVFYLMDYYDANLDEIYAWSPKDLNAYSSRLGLSRLEAGFELVFYILFIAWWNNILSWPALTSFGSETATLSLSAEWTSVFWSINIIAGLSVAVRIHKFVLASWSRFSLTTDIVLSLATLVVISQIFQFSEYINYIGPAAEATNWAPVVEHIDKVIYSIMTIVAGVCLWEIVSHSRKITYK